MSPKFLKEYLEEEIMDTRAELNIITERLDFLVHMLEFLEQKGE